MYPLEIAATSKNLGDTSSRKFAEPSSSSLAPSIAVCAVKIAANNPRRGPRTNSRGTEVAYRGLTRPSCFCVPLHGTKSDKHQGPSQQPKTTYNVTSRLPTLTLLEFGPEQCPFKNGIHQGAPPEPHPDVPSMPNQTSAPN
eukprot:1160996-Pelagomonas_calceolata.AAC.6